MFNIIRLKVIPLRSPLYNSSYSILSWEQSLWTSIIITIGYHDFCRIAFHLFKLAIFLQVT